MQRVVIDTDPGTDDALAIMMALSSPKLEVLGVTTVGGNASLAHTTRNALRLLEYLGRPQVPVSPGAARPLRGRFRYAYHIHGPEGLTVDLPEPASKPVSRRAPDYIAAMASHHPGELVLVALGPLTNVARAMKKEPRLPELLKGIVAMGGALEVPGNVTPHAEFNVYNDPLAADVVLSSGTPVTLVGLDVCERVYVGRGERAWPPGDSRGERLAQAIVANWFASHEDSQRYVLYDPLAIVAAVEPEALLYRRGTVTVVTKGEELMGKTTAAYEGGHVKVATEVDPSRAQEAMAALMKGQT